MGKQLKIACLLNIRAKMKYKEITYKYICLLSNPNNPPNANLNPWITTSLATLWGIRTK